MMKTKRKPRRKKVKVRFSDKLVLYKWMLNLFEVRNLDDLSVDLKKYGGGAKYRFSMPGRTLKGYGRTIELCRKMIDEIEGDSRYQTMQIKPR